MCMGDVPRYLALCENKDKMLYEYCNFMGSRSLIIGADRGKGKLKKPPSQPTPAAALPVQTHSFAPAKPCRQGPLRR